MKRLTTAACLAVLLAAGCVAKRSSPELSQQPVPATQLAGRIPTKPYLNMPQSAKGEIPRLLSQTGAFANVRALTPVQGAVPYELVLAFWSDGATKDRFAAIPQGQVGFTVDGDWTFPPGTVFVKTFNLPVDTARPDEKRRIETRLLVIGANGRPYGVSYRWRPDLSDADLVGPEGLNVPIPIRRSTGPATQTWLYPSRENCITCHNDKTTGVLGPKTRQLNTDLRYPDGVTENQLVHWNRLGLLSPAPNDQDVASYAKLARPDDASRSLEDRARSYLDANCAQCHRPGGTVANFDARWQTPLAQQNLIEGPVLINNGIDHPHVISPHDPWRSMIIRRTDTNDDTRMPPIARHTIDAQGVALLKAYILSLPGRDVLAPPALAPAGGEFKAPITVSLSSPDAGAQIHYTTDGSAPGEGDPVYDKPIKIDGPTVVRARAYKNGMTDSIVVQQTYIVGG